MLHVHRQRVDVPVRFFFFNYSATTEIYTLSLHDALPIFGLTATVAAKPGKPHSPHAHAQKAKKAKHAVHGVVEAVGSDSITLTLKNGDSLTILVTPDTKIRVNGKPGSLSDIQVGYKA